MLVLNRKHGEKIVIDRNIELIVLDVCGNSVTLGVQSPPEVPFHRQEVCQCLHDEAGADVRSATSEDFTESTDSTRLRNQRRKKCQ